jgi:hypothetical protein
MATLSTGQLTLFDLAKRSDPNGSAAKVAEMLSQKNDVLEDMVVVEGNEKTGHTYTQRTGLPAVFFRQVNAGVPSSKSTTAQVTEGAALMEAYSTIDERVIKIAKDPQAARLSEDSAFLEAMNQQQVSTMFYGNVATDAKTYTGLSTRYSSTTAGNGANIILGGGAGADNCSVWLIGWGENTVFSFYPDGTTAGLRMNDLGLETVFDTSVNPPTHYRGWRTQFVWENGLATKDWRYVVRIANIDVSDLLAQTGTQLNTAATQLVYLMSRAMDRIPAWNDIRPAFYMNRTAYSGLRIAALNKSNAALAIDDALSQFGNPMKGRLTFQGIPIRCVDQLTIAETLVS